MLKLVVFSGLVAVCMSFSCEDGNQLLNIGCYKRNSGVFNVMLANNRDSSVSSYIGEAIDWSNYGESMKKLACACSAKAKEGGYHAFALGFYGECFGSNDQSGYDSLIADDSERSNACVNGEYGECTGTECIGKANAEYIYTFPAAAPVKVDGGYSEWSEYSECTKTCGGGAQFRERSCTNPLPDNGGAACDVLGENSESRACNENPCPVDGQYGEWKEFGTCDKSCGGGSQQRTRACDSPAPAHGGKGCEGQSEESQSCNNQECPVDGKYSAWTAYGPCDKSCGGGSQQRTRSCTNPAPAHGGSNCEGAAEQSQACNTQACPVDGKYSAWTAYGSCDKSCGGGSKKRTRSCTNPAPAHGGSNCVGAAEESKTCNTQPCFSSTGCYYKYTSFNDDEGAFYLDRHTMHCPTGYVINAIRLERNSGHDKMRYRYRCCKSQLSCSDSLTTNGNTYNGGGDDGNSVYLDRQTLNCYNKGMSYFKIDRSGDNWKYKYDCCKIGYTSATVSCSDKSTSLSDDGDGNVVYLDRHNIYCSSDSQFITYLKLNRNSGHDKIQYNYRCCSINTLPVTN